jgi:hypothetical protein
MTATALTVLAAPALAEAASFTDSTVQQVVLAEMTGDGKPDLVLVNGTSNELWIHPGTGTGRSVYPSFKIGNGWSGRIYAAGDFDKDGRQDLLLRASNGDLWLYRVTGYSGADQIPSFRAVWIGNGWTHMQIVVPGDVTGDGYPDIIAVDTKDTVNGKMYLYANKGKAGIGVTKTGEVGHGWQQLDIYPSGLLNGGGKPGLLALHRATYKLYHYTISGTTVAKVGEVGSGWGGLQKSYVNVPLFASGYNLDNSQGTEIVAKIGTGWWVYHRSTSNSWSKPDPFTVVQKPSVTLKLTSLVASQTSGNTWKFTARTNTRVDSVSIEFDDKFDGTGLTTFGMIRSGTDSAGAETWTYSRTITGQGHVYKASVRAKLGNQTAIRRTGATVTHPVTAAMPTKKSTKLDALAKQLGVGLLYATGSFYSYENGRWVSHYGTVVPHTTQVNVNPNPYNDVSIDQDTLRHEAAHVAIAKKCGFGRGISENEETVTDVYAMQYLGMSPSHAWKFGGHGDRATQAQENQAAAIHSLPDTFTDPQFSPSDLGKSIPTACSI